MLTVRGDLLQFLHLFGVPNMSALYFFMILLLFGENSVSPALAASRRGKRSLLELAGVIKCSTGRSAVSYVMYGCYCGLGGRGWPKDSADWCCHRHDCCYGKVETLGCQSKTDQYQWACKEHAADCDSLSDKCERMLCLCDREAAGCLGRVSYNPKYCVWPDFLCGEEQPPCAMS